MFQRDETRTRTRRDTAETPDEREDQDDEAPVALLRLCDSGDVRCHTTTDNNGMDTTTTANNGMDNNGMDTTDTDNNHRYERAHTQLRFPDFWGFLLAVISWRAK